MLVLSRRIQESVIVGDAEGVERMITVTVLEIQGARVKLGFEAGDLPVHRCEVWDRIHPGGMAVPPPGPVAPGP
jgi:carbon storage regulator CsrA